MQSSEDRSKRIRTYRDLIVWQKSMDVARGIYRSTKTFPKEERFGLTAQVRRSAVSVPSNIAEGFGRRRAGDYSRFLSIAMGSLFEMEAQLTLSKDFGFLDSEDYREIASLIEEVERMLESLVRKVS